MRLTISVFLREAWKKTDPGPRGTWFANGSRADQGAQAHVANAPPRVNARVSFSAVLNYPVNLDRGKSDDVRVPLIMRHTLRRQARVFPHDRLGTFVKR